MIYNRTRGRGRSRGFMRRRLAEQYRNQNIMRNTAQQQNIENNKNIEKTQQRTCWKCGKPGHEKKDCIYNNRNNNNNNNNNNYNRNNRNRRDYNIRPQRREMNILQKVAHSEFDTGHYEAALYPLQSLETAIMYPDEDMKVPVFFELNNKIIKTAAFLDTGASLSVIKRRFAESRGFKIERTKEFNCKTGNGKISIKYQTKVTTVDMDYFGDNKAVKFDVIYYILDDIPFDIILGRSLMKKLRYRIIRLEREYVHHEPTQQFMQQATDSDFYNRLLLVPNEQQLQRQKTLQHQLQFYTEHILYIKQQQQYPRPLDIDKLRTQQVQNEKQILSVDIKEKVTTTLKCGKIHDINVKQQFDKIIKTHQSVIAKHWSDVGLIENATLKLELKDETVRINKPPYRTSYKMQQECKRQCDELLQAGFIERSSSQYAAPVIFVPKKKIDGKIEYRMCVDYRELNKNTKPDLYPIPNISDLYTKFYGKKLFTSLDLRHAYHHIGIEQKDRPKTAFITPFGLFQWTRMSFGFKNAPSCFQRCMDSIFKDMKQVVIYLDDILIIADTEQEMCCLIGKVFEKLNKHNLKIRLDKCKFFMPELLYLGHIISSLGMKPDPQYVKRILNIKKPQDRKEVERFSGLVNWLSKYVARLSQVIEPINRLRRKTVDFIWGAEQENAFNKIKKAIEQAPILKHPDFNKTFYLCCDASAIACGAVLLQKYGNTLYPVEFYSRLFDQQQRRWHISEKEMVSVVWTCEKWRKYLIPRKFHIFTDHRNLVDLMNITTSKAHKSKLHRWLVRLQD